MAVSAGDRSQQFVKDWVDAFLKHWTKQATRLGAGKYDEREARTFASDQGPLLDVAQQRCKEEETTKPPWKLGALPRTMNVRDADAAPDLVCLSYTHDDDYEEYKVLPPGKKTKRDRGG